MEDNNTAPDGETPAETPRQKNARTLHERRRSTGRSVADPSKLKHSREQRKTIFSTALQRLHYTVADAEKFGCSKVAFTRWITGKTAPELEAFVRLLELENIKDKQKTVAGISQLETLLAEMKAKVAE